MRTVTEENLLIARQPQRLFTAYNFPLPVVVDMINEAVEQNRQEVKGFLCSLDSQAVEQIISSAHSHFAARKHRHKNTVSVIRIHFTFAKKDSTDDSPSVLVLSAEAIGEREYQPVLPI
jgi:hypothetical protein